MISLKKCYYAATDHSEVFNHASLHSLEAINIIDIGPKNFEIENFNNTFSPAFNFIVLKTLKWIYFELDHYSLKNDRFLALHSLRFPDGFRSFDYNYRVISSKSAHSETRVLFGRLIFIDLCRRDVTSIASSILCYSASMPLTSLEKLTLGGNQITMVKCDDFSGLSQLRILHLGSNKIGSIEPGSFSDLCSLTSLHLSHNSIEKLDHSVFSGLENLKFLDLSHNSVQSIGQSSFRDLVSLEEFDFSFSESEAAVQIDEEFLLGLTSLTWLYLKNNRVEYIASKAFVHTPNLVHLNLSRNRIAQINKDTFVGLEKLKHLDFSYNPIELIHKDVFRNLKALNRLGLSYIPNALELCPSDFPESDELMFVNLVYTDIKRRGDFEWDRTKFCLYFNLK